MDIKPWPSTGDDFGYMHGHLPQPRALFIRNYAGERFSLNLYNHAALLLSTRNSSPTLPEHLALYKRRY